MSIRKASALSLIACFFLTPGFSLPTDGMIAYFPLNGDTLDASGSGNHGTRVGASFVADRRGTLNSALGLDKNGYVQINNTALLNGATQAAISVWVLSRVPSSEIGFIVAAGDDRGGLDPFDISVREGSSLTYFFTDCALGPDHPDRSIGAEGSHEVAMPLEQWTHILMQFHSAGGQTDLELFMNGQLVKQLHYDRSHRVHFDRPMPVQIGCLSSNQGAMFRGVIDDVRFYNRSLSHAEVAELFDAESVDSSPSAPAFTLYPLNPSIVAEGSVNLSVAASGNPAPAFQWQLSTDGGGTWAGLSDAGAYSGTATASLLIRGATIAMNGHRFRCIATNTEGAATSNAGVLSVMASAGPRLINVSCRAFSGAGDSTLVMGFYISGDGSKTLLIRGVGPRLLDYNVPAVVENPSLTVYTDQTPIASNDDWDPSLAADFAQVGAFALNNGSRDAAFKVTLAPGGYTVHLVNNGPVAEALIEVYDVSRDTMNRLTNVSCRLDMNPGETVILGTALIGGQVSVLARNVGPELATYGIPIATVLADPHLRVYQGPTEIGANDDWEPATSAYFGPVGAFPLSVGSKDAAVRVPFSSGGYTAHATGKGGGGIALIELYESP